MIYAPHVECEINLHLPILTWFDFILSYWNIFAVDASSINSPKALFYSEAETSWIKCATFALELTCFEWEHE